MTLAAEKALLRQTRQAAPARRGHGARIGYGPPWRGRRHENVIRLLALQKLGGGRRAARRRRPPACHRGNAAHRKMLVR